MARQKAKAARGRQLCLDAEVLETWPERAMEGFASGRAAGVRGTKGIPEEAFTHRRANWDHFLTRHKNQLK